MLSFDTPHGQFNYRVAAVVRRRDEVLLQTIGDADFWCLPGGRVDFGESGEEAIRREIQEELGLQPQVERLLWVVENLYQHNGAAYHEPSLYFLLSLPEDCDAMRARAPWKTAELDGTPLLFEWHPVEGLERLNLVPSFLRRELRVLPQVVHYILHRGG